jgi:hypothetical protein
MPFANNGKEDTPSSCDDYSFFHQKNGRKRREKILFFATDNTKETLSCHENLVRHLTVCKKGQKRNHRRKTLDEK